jgi:hypothetical protein
MATNLIRFEIVVPNVDIGSPADIAIDNFINNMLTLTQLVMSTSYVYPQGGNNTNFVEHAILYGLITTAQQATALGYLNTLNAALGQNVLCTVNQVTQEP